MNKNYLKASSSRDHYPYDFVLHHQGIIGREVAANSNTSQSGQEASAGKDHVDIVPPAASQLSHGSEGGNHNPSWDEEAPAKAQQPTMNLQCRAFYEFKLCCANLCGVTSMHVSNYDKKDAQQPGIRGSDSPSLFCL